MEVLFYKNSSVRIDKALVTSKEWCNICTKTVDEQNHTK